MSGPSPRSEVSERSRLSWSGRVNSGARSPGVSIRRLLRWPAELDLHQRIVCGIEAQAAIGAVRGLVVTVHVQAQAADLRVGARQPLEMAEECREYAATSRLGEHVHGLDPPEKAIAPIAPLGGEHELSHGLPVALGDEVATLGRRREQRLDAGTQLRRIEFLVLGFACQPRIAVDD